MLAYTTPVLAQAGTPATAGMPQKATTPVAGEAVTAKAEMGDIIVTAQRRSERLRDVPLTITAQTGADLARAGISSTKELGIAVPGLVFTTQGAWAQPNIRGISTSNSTTGAESPIALYVDGVYYSNQIGSVFDMPDVERLEVLKGPQGTLFGRNATGGAISIHTLDPSLSEATGKLTVMDGVFFGDDVKTANEITVKGFVSVPISDTLAFSAAGYYDYINGYLTNDRTGGRAGKREAYMMRSKLLFEPTDSIKFLLTGFYGRDEDFINSNLQPLNGVTSVNGQIRSVPGDLTSPLVRAFPNGVVPTQPWHIASELKGGSSILTHTGGVNLKADFTFDGAGTLSSLTSYLYVKAEPTVDVDAAFGGISAPQLGSLPCLTLFSCVNFGVLNKNRSFQQEVTFASEKFGRFSFVGGVFYYKDRATKGENINFPLGPNGERDLSPFGNPPGPVYDGGLLTTTAKAVFGEANYDLTDALHVIAGIRYSDEKKRQTNYIGLEQTPLPGAADGWSDWTPRFSLRYDLSSSANIYATYSKGFKSGILNSVGFTVAAADPETLTAYEIGTKIGSSDFSLNLSGFYYDYKKLQVQFFDGVTSSLQNAANARIYGFEADANVRVTPELQLRLAGSWVPYAKYKSFTGGVANDFYPQNDPTLNPNGFGPVGPGGLRPVVGIDASGQRILKTPRFTGNATLTYTAETGMGKIEANGTIYYSSSFDWELLKRVRTNGYVTVSGRVGLTPTNSRFQFSIFGKNLFNEHHFGGAVVSSFADTVLRTPPRQLGLSIDYAF
ncbi:MAG: TonB-dependent receptor [Sphingobium sp.]